MKATVGHVLGTISSLECEKKVAPCPECVSSTSENMPMQLQFGEK